MENDDPSEAAANDKPDSAAKGGVQGRRMPCKKQHFVPQHYLRLFRMKGTNLIVAALVHPFKFIGPASIKHQCQQDYFYEDRVVDELITSLEGDLAPKLLRLVRNESFNSSEQISLNYLAASLNLRTRKAAKVAKLFPKHIADEFIKHSIETGRLPSPKGGWSQDMIDFTGIPGFLFMNAILPAAMEMGTLDCRLLKASPNSFFITSDNPVVLFNQLFKDDNPHRSFAGFGLSGFQLILPVSPTLCLFFYDPNVYHVGSGRHQVTRICKADANILNSFQVQNAEKCIYCHDARLQGPIQELAESYSTYRSPVENALRTFEDPQGRGEFVHVRNQSVKMPKPWNFCRIRRNPFVGPQRRRDPMWTECVNKMIDAIDTDPDGRDIKRSMERVLDEMFPGSNLAS